MSNAEFWLYYLNNIEVGIFYGFTILVINFLIFRRYIYSIFDPFVIVLLSSSLAYSVVFFLFHLNLISEYYFFSFIGTQTAFFIGFLLIKPIKLRIVMKKSVVNTLHFSLSAKYLYYISALLFILSQLFVYYIAGIPLFMESRLEVFSGGGGFGIFNRIIPVTSSIVSIIVFYKLFFVSYKLLYDKLFDYLLVVFIVVVALLSGSKSSFLGLIYVIFFISLFNYKIANKNVKKVLKKIRKVQWKLFLFAVVSTLGIIALQSFLKYGDKETISPILKLIMRFVNTGDIYMYAYPNNFLEQMEQGNPFLALFKDVLGMFRIIPWNELPNHIGLQLYQTYYNTDIVMGPNARHNVFGLFYLGPIWSIFLSFALGVLISLLRNTLYFKVNSNVIGMVIYILIAKSALGFEADPPYSISVYLSMFIIFIPLYFISIIISKTRRKLVL